jgi:hypothetical protein
MLSWFLAFCLHVSIFPQDLPSFSLPSRPLETLEVIAPVRVSIDLHEIYKKIHTSAHAVNARGDLISLSPSHCTLNTVRFLTFSTLAHALFLLHAFHLKDACNACANPQTTDRLNGSNSRAPVYSAGAGRIPPVGNSTLKLLFVS